MAKITPGKLSLSGMKSSISNFFAPQTYGLSDILGEKDIECIKAYNSEIDACTTTQTAYNRTMLDASDTAKDMVMGADGNKIALDGYTKSSKAAEFATKALATAGNMLLMWAIGKAISFIAKTIDNFIHRLDKAKEALQNTESELSNVRNEIDEINEKIKELEGKDSLSITDKADLKQLKEQNEELRVREQYLQRKKQNDAKKVSKLAESEYALKYNAVTQEDVNNYKYRYNHATTFASSYLTGNTVSTGTPYAAQTVQQEEDTLTSLIGDYQYYVNLKKLAIQSKDAEEIDKCNQKLGILETKLADSRTELQGFKEDLEADGGTSPYLEEVIQNIKIIDDTVLSREENLVNFLNQNKKQKDEIAELINNGKLTQEELDKFPEINKYLKENGFTLEDLISLTKLYKEELSETSSKDLAVPTILSKVQDLSKGLDQLASIYSDVKDKNGFDFSSIFTDDFAETFSGFTDEYTNLINTITKSPNDINACQEAFNKLATAYIFSTEALSNLTKESQKSAVNMLKSMGISNAKEVVSDILKAKEAYSELASEREEIINKDLDSATASDIDNLLKTQDVSAETTQKIVAYWTQKNKANLTTLITNGDITNLKALVTACGGAVTALNAYEKAKEILNSSNGHHPVYSQKDYIILKNSLITVM